MLVSGDVAYASRAQALMARRELDPVAAGVRDPDQTLFFSSVILRAETFIFPRFAGTSRVSRPGLEPGT